jgi:hypothetical protein
MRVKHIVATAFLLPVLSSLFAVGCLGDGESEDTKESKESQEIDCGENGSAHGDHCHCFQGYLFDGEACAAPDQITETCKAVDDGESKSACVCPESGTCPCDGDIEEYGGKKYCVPALD